MHKFICFDTETTSCIKKTLRTNGGEVIQFSGIIFDDKFNIEKVINRYCTTAQVFDSRASSVHKLNDNLVMELSQGKFFEQIVLEEGLRDFSNITWIGFNSINFDIPLMNQTLIQNGYPSIYFGKTVNTLSFDRKGIFKYDCMLPLGISLSGRQQKLSTLTNRYLGEELFIEKCKTFRKAYNIIEPNKNENSFFHNAVYDSFALYLLLYKCRAYLFE